MIISNNQIKSLEYERRKDFERRFIDCMRKHHKQTFGILNELQQHEFAATMIDHSRKYGFITEKMVVRFANIALVLGPDFDEKITDEQVANLLKRQNQTPEVRMILLENYTRNNLKARLKI